MKIALHAANRKYQVTVPSGLTTTVPLVGWAYSSASGYPVVWFGVLPLPDFVSPDKALAAQIKPWHGRLAYTLAALVVLSGRASGLSSTFDVRWYYLLGGILGAAYVFAALSTVGSIGAGGVAAATITGQLTMSVVIDRLGILGLEQTPITAPRVIGVVLLLAGTYLIVR